MNERRRPSWTALLSGTVGISRVTNPVTNSSRWLVTTKIATRYRATDSSQ